jgi:PST family polysaccharide transporter
MLAMQATSSLVVFTIAWREIFRLHVIERPSPARLFATFKQGWDMFMFAGASSALGLGNVLLLSLFAPTTLVGYYAGAEKLCRGFVGALWPLNQAIFPRINHLCHTDAPAGARMVLRSLAIMGCGGLLVFIAAVTFAPEVIRLVLGPGFEPAIPTLRMMSPIILTMPLNIVFGLQWSVPMGLDRAYSRIILLAVVFNVAVAFFLAPRYAHFGMAATVALTEAFVLCGVLLMLKKNNLSPFRIARRDLPSELMPHGAMSEG